VRPRIYRGAGVDVPDARKSIAVSMPYDRPARHIVRHRAAGRAQWSQPQPTGTSTQRLTVGVSRGPTRLVDRSPRARAVVP
jgi:hypothetical protein